MDNPDPDASGRVHWNLPQRFIAWPTRAFVRRGREVDTQEGGEKQAASGIASKDNTGHTLIDIRDEQPNNGTPGVKKPAPFRPEAKVWDLYLDLAEREAKERAALWNTSLDSLLIFAGLFAGVVSSFVIDARADVQADSEQRLLKGLFEKAESGSITTQLSTPTIAYWVSALWALSLCTTLFGAIMAVLAKAWLAKYIVPSARRRKEDAQDRYRADEVALLWHTKVVLVLPFLVQFAALLFVLGLILQLHADSPTIGRIILGFGAFGLTIYIVTTCLPLIASWSPVSTPLSEVVALLLPGRPFDRGQVVVKAKNGHDVVFNILYHKMILSDKDAVIDEAIAAIADLALPSAEQQDTLPGADHKYTPLPFVGQWSALAETEMPRVLLWRMRYYATSTMDDVARQQDVLCTHLLLFIALADFYELLPSPRAEPTQYQTLEYTLRQLMEFRFPLHRWGELPKSCLALSIRLRSQLLVLFPPAVQPSTVLRDLDADELKGHLFEFVHSGISSSHRIHVALASCRGLAQGGQSQLSSISAFTLSLCLGTAAFSASATEQTSEWASGLAGTEQEDAKALATRYMSKLYQVTVEEWGRMASNTLPSSLSVELPLALEETEMARSHARGVLRSLIFGLSQQNHSLRMHSIRMLKHVSSPTNPVLDPDLINEPVKSIASMAVYDRQGVREDGLHLLTELSGVDDDMAQAIRTALVNSVHSGLSKYEDQPRVATVQFIEKLSTPDSQSQFVSVINDVIPRLTEITFDESSSERVRGAAMKLLRRLWDNGFVDVKRAILRYLDKPLDSSEFRSRYNFLNALQRLAKAKDFPQGNDRLPSSFPWSTPSDFVKEAITKMFDKLIKVAIYDEDSTVYTAAQDILAFVARDDRFYHLPLEVLDWLDAATVNSSRWRARLNAVLVVQMFVKRLRVTEELLKKVLKLALRDDDDDVRATSLELALTFLQDDRTMESFAGRVKDTIVTDSPENIISFESYTYITDHWVPLLIKITKTVSFPESIPFLVQRAMAADDGSDTRIAIMGYLASDHFAADSTSHEALKKAIPRDILAHVVLPNLEDVLTKRRWVTLLADLLPIECLNQLATDALFPVKNSVKATLNGSAVNAAEKDDADTTTEESEDVSYLAESTVSASLRRLIYKAGWYERMHWAAILATLSAIYPEEFPEAPKIVLAVAVHDYDSDVRHGTLQSLRSLVNADATRQGLLEGVMENMDRLAQDSDWNVRFALAQVLAAFVKSNECELPKEGTDKLATMAIDDRDYDVRSESVNSLAVIVENEGRYPEASRLALEKFDAGIKDGHWKPRQSWVNFIAPQLKYAESPHVTRVFDVAISDSGPDVRNTALEVLEQLLKGKDSKLRDSMASQLGKFIAAALKNPDLRESATSALIKLTLPDGQPPDEKPFGHETWTQIIVLLGRNEFQGVSKLIEMAIKEDSADSFTVLATMFQKAKLRDPIQTVLPRFLESALKIDGNTANDVRIGAVELMSRLTGVERDEPYYGELLGETNDAQIVSRLSDIAVKDVDDGLRKSALKLLKSLFSETSRFPDLVESFLSKALESCFRDPELMKYRYNAIAVLHSLTKASTHDDCGRFQDIVSPSISHLLKMTLLVTDKEHEYIRKQAEDILLENLTAYPTETKLNKDVLSAIPAMIPSVSGEGRRIVLQLAETLQLSDETAASIAHALAPLLRTTSSFARATAIELLSRLYSAHKTSNPRLIESAIPEVITLALDEKDDVGETRTMAIQLLVARWAALKAGNDEDNTAASSMNSPVVKQITPLETRFMGLLLNENLRPSVVELLSLMATEATVRRTISLQIMSLAFGKDSVSLQAHTDLLARLISDGRFSDEPTDKVMLFVASAMVTRPKLSPYRFEILTALWCRYASKSIVPTLQGAAGMLLERNDLQLVDWFTFALFGRHATVPEVRTWVKRCEVWLPYDAEPMQTSGNPRRLIGLPLSR